MAQEIDPYMKSIGDDSTIDADSWGGILPEGVNVNELRQRNTPVEGHPDELDGFIPDPAGAPPFMAEAIPVNLFKANNEAVEAGLIDPLVDPTDPKYFRSNHEGDSLETDTQSLSDQNLPPDPNSSNDIYPSTSVETEADNSSDALDDTDSPDSGQADSSPLSKEDKDELVKQCLEEDIQQNINTQTLLFDYGPFHAMEKEMGEFVHGAVEPSIAEVVMSHVRQAIHDAVSSNKNLQQDKNSDLGLFARIEASKEISGSMRAYLAPVLSKLNTLHVEGSGSIGNGLDQIVKSAENEFIRKAKTLAPVSLGGHLFNKLIHQIAPVFAPGITGNVRKHRNKELTTSLSELGTVADELKKNAGNLDWERSHGAICTKSVSDITKRIQSLTKGVEGQVDSVSLNKGLKDINKVLGEAADASEDPDHKNRLTEVKELMAFVAKAIVDAIAKLFGKDAGPSGAKPSM